MTALYFTLATGAAIVALAYLAIRSLDHWLDEQFKGPPE